MSVTLNKFAQYANYLRRLIHIFFLLHHKYRTFYSMKTLGKIINIYIRSATIESQSVKPLVRGN